MAAEGQTLLDFESAMFLELTEGDGLFVTARYCCTTIILVCFLISKYFLLVFRGIKVSRVLTNFLKMYCDPAALVIVVNASDYEEVW